MRVPVMLKLRWEPMSEKWTEIWAYEAEKVEKIVYPMHGIDVVL